jgi:carbamoyl-phosphate synthase large subunit
VPVAKIAARLMAGETLDDFDLPEDPTRDHVAVKEAVFPFSRFPGVDIILGPEMKSTGEVMGIAADFPTAFAKSQLGAGMKLPDQGGVFVSVKDGDKPKLLPIVRQLHELGFTLMATGGTQAYFEENGVPCERVNKVLQGRPHCVDAIISGQVQLVINTTEGAQAIADSYSIRRSALNQNVPHYTTVTAAAAAVAAIAALRAAAGPGGLEVAPLQAYFQQSF